jgi:hypothetical protein
MCCVLCVSRSVYEGWDYGDGQPSSAHRGRCDAEVAAAFRECSGHDGSRRRHAEPLEPGVDLSRTRVVSAMRWIGLRHRSRCRLRATTDSRHSPEVAPKLLQRDLCAAHRHGAWVGAITDVRKREAWLYPAVLIDLNSRRVDG